MKKLFKRLLIGVLSAVLLVSSLSVASANENQGWYDNLIRTKKYLEYIDINEYDIQYKSIQYSLIDINNDKIQELILKINSDGPYNDYYIFKYDSINKEPNFIGKLNLYGNIWYSDKFNMVVGIYGHPNFDNMEFTYYSIQDEYILVKTYLGYSGNDYYIINAETTISSNITQSEYEYYSSNFININFLDLENYKYLNEDAIYFTDEQLNNIKKSLGVPDDLNVDIKVSDTASYWDSAQIWIVNVDIIYNGQSVAGALVDKDSAELARSIWMFSYDNIENFEPILDYEYNQTDEGESLTIPTVNDVTTETEAVSKVQTAVTQATDEQKQSATGIDKLTLLAEEATAKANTVKLTDSNVNITAENIKESTALQSTTNVLTTANVQMQRTARNIVNYDLGDTETINVKTENVSNKVDAVRVSTSYASATVNANTASDFTMTNKGEKTVEINFNKETDTTITVSFPNMNENDKYYAVVDENGNPVGGKYNPATGTLEAKLTESGIYKVVNNEKDFADIKDKSAEMQEAIKVLASKGIINGTTATTFVPDNTISRAEVTALLMRTISLLDPNANGNFADVSTSNWYCGAAGSAKEHNIINGYEDNTFRGNAVIAKDQIVAVSARTLKQQMNYKTPSDVAGELSVYSDANSIANWAKEDVALATMANLVLKRTDSTFSGADGMTRGDAAIIMQRLFNKLW